MLPGLSNTVQEADTCVLISIEDEQEQQQELDSRKNGHVVSVIPKDEILRKSRNLIILLIVPNCRKRKAMGQDFETLVKSKLIKKQDIHVLNGKNMQVLHICLQGLKVNGRRRGGYICIIFTNYITFMIEKLRVYLFSEDYRIS